MKKRSKKCPKCGKRKYRKSFDKNAARSDGLDVYCRICHKQYQKRWREAHPIQKAHAAFVSGLKVKYGLSLAQFEILLKRQKKVCAICKKPEQRNRRLSVDHCHSSKQVRGLLCDKCNVGIGRFNDDPKLIKRAYQYLLQ